MYLVISDYEMNSLIKYLVFLETGRFYIRIYNHFIFRNQLIALLLSHLIKLRFNVQKTLNVEISTSKLFWIKNMKFP